jgi:hypothetical protein
MDKSFLVHWAHLLLQHQLELMQERDRQIMSFTKRYKIPGYENVPTSSGSSQAFFTSEQCSKLLSKTHAMLQQLKEKITEIKVIFGYLLWYLNIQSISPREITILETIIWVWPWTN